MCMRGTTSEPAYDGWKVSCWFLAAFSFVTVGGVCGDDR